MNRGGRGRNGQSVKRKPNTPVGGAYKDQRRGLNSNDMDYEEEGDEEWTEVNYTRRSPQRQQQQQPQPQSDQMAQSNAQSTQERPSFASISAQPTSSSMQNRRNSTASANYIPKKTLEKLLVTPPPEGSMRDDITIEIQTINGRPFKGSLTLDEAKNGIFVKCLELNPGLLHGL